MIKRLLLAALLLLPAPALAQVVLYPPITAGHCVSWRSLNIIQDAGAACGTGAGSVTSVAETFTGGLISVAGSPITTSGTFALTVAGTSGGIPYFSSGTTWASSAALAANAIVIGGGAGVAPSTTTTGTGVLTALGTNVGSAGAVVTFNGAGGTPSSLTLTNATGLPIGGITGLGTGVGAALAIAVGSAGGPVVFNGAGGTPSSMVGTNITGTAAGLTAGVASAVAASGITGTTLASNVVASSLTSVGQLTSLTINGTLLSGTKLTVNYDSTTQSAWGIHNTAASGTDWIFGDGVGLAAGSMGFYSSTNSRLILALNAATTGAITFGGSNYTTCTALTTSSNVVTCTVSDSRLKNDEAIISDENALSKIVAMPDLHLITYKQYDDTEADRDGSGKFTLRAVKRFYGPEGQHYAFMAQDVEKVMPELVRKDGPKSELTPEGSYQFDKNEVVPLLVGAIKAQQAQILALQKQVAGIQPINDNSSKGRFPYPRLLKTASR